MEWSPPNAPEHAGLFEAGTDDGSALVVTSKPARIFISWRTDSSVETSIRSPSPISFDQLLDIFAARCYSFSRVPKTQQISALRGSPEGG